jgi:predicted PurR-regulated permease PerM
MEGSRAASSADSWSLEFVAKGTLIVIGLWALANGIWMARDVLFITFFALLIASFLSIFVEPLHRRGVSRAIAAPAVLAAFILLLVGLALVVWPTLSAQFDVIREQLPSAIDRLQKWFAAQSRALMGSFGSTGQAVQREMGSRMTNDLSSMVGGALPLLNTALGAITGLLLIIVAGMFIAVAPRTYMRGLIVLIPKSHRQRMGEVLPKTGVAMVQWMKGTAAGMLIVGAMSALGLWLIGVPAALALGLIAGLLEFIPYVGPTLSFVPAIVVALAISPEKAIWVVVLYAIIQLFESNLIMPLLMKQMVALPPALTLLFQALMATLFGFLGLLLAVPMLATVKILVQELYVEGVADER